MCLGNHEYKAFRSNKEGLQNFIREIEALGVEVLINRTVVVEKDGQKYNIIGFDDLRRGSPDIEKAMDDCIPNAPKIAITHNPDLVLSIPGKIVDYMFAGHFHGGQIWMPFNLEFMILRDDQLCRMGITRGLKRVNGIRVYLNRGLGNGVVPLRFLSRPEILHMHHTLTALGHVGMAMVLFLQNKQTTPVDRFMPALYHLISSAVLQAFLFPSHSLACPAVRTYSSYMLQRRADRMG